MDILADPASYYGKTIRVVGSLKHNQVTDDRLFPSTIADFNGNDPGIDPRESPFHEGLGKKRPIPTSFPYLTRGSFLVPSFREFVDVVSRTGLEPVTG
jgi:hypothetical protein